MINSSSKGSLNFLVFFFLISMYSLSAQETALRVNAGGVSSNYNGKEFIADTYFDTGNTLVRPQTGLPEPFKSFRYSPSKTMSYDIPLPDGEYTINLYFSELWFGATGGGSGGAGSRVFDVTIEGQLAQDNLDIFAEVGADAMLMKSHVVTVSGGNLDIDFNSNDAVGGQRHPIINAIEVLSNEVQNSATSVNPISNQFNEINDEVSLAASASGGDPNSDFTFSISGQPSGVSMNGTTGLITGSIDESAAAGGLNDDGVFQVTIIASKSGSEDASVTFVWTISDATCVWNSLTDANVNRFEGISQKIGDKLYILGGFTYGVKVVPETEIYDTTNDAYTFGAPMPIPVTHTAAVAAGSDVYILGGFVGDNPGVATNAVQVYNTLTNSWSVGPDLPNPVGSGAGALAGTKIHFFGGLLPDRQTDVADHLVLDLSNIGAGWTSAAPMPNPRNHHSGISVNGIVYAIGGQTGHDGAVEDTKFVHAYDPNTDQWTRLADLARPRSHFKAATTVHNGKIIIVGGVDNGPLVNDISRYDPQLNTWTELCKLPGEGLEEGAAQAFGDRLIVSGGRPVRDANIMLKETRWMQLEPNTAQPPAVNAGQDQSINLPTSSVVINGSGSDPDGGTVTFLWTQQSGPNTASLTDATSNTLTANNLIEGTYVFRLTVTDDENETRFDEVSVSVNEEPVIPDFALRINTGGTATNYGGEDFMADQYANTGSTLDRPQTGLPEPFQTFRFSRSQQMSYDIPVPDGEYTVNLYFAELWFGATAGGSGGSGSRVFDVNIEGQLAEDNLDVYAEVGADAMLVKTHTVTVTGGVLDIDFDSRDQVGGKRHPVINAIEILGSTTPQEPRPFVTTWKTDNPGTSNDNQITIPTRPGENYDYTVDWGDGSIESNIVSDADLTHTYAIPGVYSVKISGTFPAVQFSIPGDDNLKLISIDQWGDIKWSSMQGAFFKCENMDMLASDIPDLSEVTSVASMFDGCKSLIGNASFAEWDMSSITNMQALFGLAEKFNQPIGNWNVGNVLTMNNLFNGASQFNQDISNWDVSKVTNMGYMFANATNFNQNISNWDTSSVLTMDSVFANAVNFNQDIGGWNVGSLTNLEGVFSGATSFNQDIGNWDVRNVTYTFGMFYDATSFDQNLGNWDISGLTDATDMFVNTGLSPENYDGTLIGWSILDQGEIQVPNNIQFAGGTSQYCQGEAARQKLINDFGWTITDGGKSTDCPDTTSFITTWKTDNIGQSADNQITIPTYNQYGYNYSVSWGDGTSDANVTGDITHTYSAPGTYQVSISGDFPTMHVSSYPGDEANSDSNKLLEVNQWGDIQWATMLGSFAGCINMDVVATDVPDLSGVTNLFSMFEYCHSLIGNESFSAWDVSTITDMTQVFHDAPLFNLDISGWDVSNVTHMGNLFANCQSFNQDISGWNVSNVTNMGTMFNAATSFNQDLSNWDVSKVTSMAGMFNFTSFNQDISGWDVGNVTDMVFMFNLNTAFNQDISGWDVSKATHMMRMFGGATSFDQNLSNWNVSNVADMTNMFDDSGLSNTNYDNLLIGWSELPTLQSGVQLDANQNSYCASKEARQSLINNYGWTINDGGEDCPEPNDFALRINTGGTQTNYNGETFMADVYFNTGSTLDRPQTGLPEPYQTFRYSPSKTMSYDIPVPDGQYTVNLYFAELWFGATGGGAGGAGNRIFDVSIEGQLAEDNLDIFAEVGADAMLMKSHTVTVSGGVLDIDFDSNDVVGGERHPVINAIEILSVSSNGSGGSLGSGKTVVVNPSILSPNPAAIITTLSFENPVELNEIQIFDITGRLVHIYQGSSVKDQGAYLLDVNELPAGTYFIRSQDTQGQQYQKQMVIKK